MENSVNVSVIQDADGNNIVMINDIAFKGKRSMNWNDVKEYLYDIINIKKRNEQPAWLLVTNTYGKKPISCLLYYSWNMVVSIVF